MTKGYFDPDDFLTKSETLKIKLVLEIEKARKEQKLSQKEIAKRANISQGQYSRIENLESTPNLETIINLAGAVGKKITLTKR